MHLRELSERRDKTFRVKEANMHLMEIKQQSPTSVKEEIALLDKVMTTNKMVNTYKKLQNTDGNFECHQFERNGKTFKQQLNDRLNKQKQFYDY